MNLLQSLRSWASQLSSWQVFPVNFLFSSTVLLHVPSGLPVFHFPGGVHFRTTWGSLLLLIRRTCPSHRHLLPFTSLTMLLMLVRLATSTLVTLCFQRILKIHLNLAFYQSLIVSSIQVRHILPQPTHLPVIRLEDPPFVGQIM